MPRLAHRPRAPWAAVPVPRAPLGPLCPEAPPHVRDFEHFPHINNYVLNVRLNMKMALRFIVMHTSNAEYIPNRIQAVKLHLTNDVVSNNTTGLVFETGYMIISGAPTLYEAVRETHRYLAFLRTVPQPVCVVAAPGGGSAAASADPCAARPANWLHGVPRAGGGGGGGGGEDYHLSLRPLARRLRCTSIDVVNIVSDGLISPLPLNLKRMSAEHAEIADYDPESFPGLRLTIAPALVRGLSRQCKAGIFDSGKAIIMGTRRKEDNVLVHRFLINFVAAYIDTERPADARSIYNYRVQKNMEPAGDELLYDFTLQARLRAAEAAAAAGDGGAARLVLAPSPAPTLLLPRARPTRTHARPRAAALAAAADAAPEILDAPPGAAADPAALTDDDLERLAAYF